VPQYIIDLRATNTYTVCYFENDKETVAHSETVVYAKEGDKAYITIPNITEFSLTVPTDYVFVGFKSFDESDTTVYKVGTKYELTSELLKLYATYEEDTSEVTSNITYELNGGSTNGNNPDTILSTATVNLFDATHESRYKKFVGWFNAAEGGEQITALTKVRHDLTLYARWEDLDPSEVDFAYTELSDGTYAVSAVSDFEYTNLVLPSQYKGKDVTEVKENGFKNITTITSITFPATIKTIRSNAFSCLSALEELSIPSTIETVETNAFDSCGLKKLNLAKANYIDPFKNNKLEEITFAEDFDTISKNMFTGLDIKNLIIPDTVKTIDQSAFITARIDVLTLPKELETLSCYAFQSAYIGTLNYLSKNASFNQGTDTSSVSTSVFYDATITKVVIGSEVESFMTDFVCPTCDELDIQLSLNAFLKVNNAIEFLSSAKDVKFNGSYLSGDITIEEGVKVLPSKLFKDKAITSLYIPDGVEYYGSNILSGCASLKELNVPATSFKTNPNNTTEVALIYLFGVNSYTGGSLYNKAGNNGYYPDALEKITARKAGAKTYNESFDFNSLKEVYLPEGGFSTSTGTNYTLKNANLEKLYIGKYTNGTSMSSGVFTNLKNLKELTLPSLDKTLKEIFSYTPSNYVIEKITILGGATIVSNEFAGYTTLKEINIPDTITSIGSYAFSEVPITEFTIGKNVTSIGSRAFASTKLSSLVIPKSVTRIDPAILYNANDMTSLSVEAGNSKYFVLGTNTIVEASDGNIKVVCTIPTSTWPNDVNTVTAYSYWFLDVNEFDLPEPTQDGKTITYEAYAFSGAKVKTLNVGTKAILNDYSLNGIVRLESLQLNNFSCAIADLFGTSSNIPSTLTSIAFGDGVTTIPANAFQGMADMTGVDGIDFSKITSIGDYAFDGCKSFSSDLNLPACTSVGKYAFRGMKNIAIYLPNCTTIGDYAFSGSSGLTYVDIHSASNKFYCIFANTSTVGVIHLGKDFKGRLFTSTTSVEGIIIDEGLTELPDNSIHTGDVRGTIGWLVLPGSVQSHGTQAICHTYNGRTYGASITTIYYSGTASQKTSFMNYSKLVNDNTANNDTSYTALQAATWYMYSESNSSGCWHFNETTGLPELY
nr:leucine-rich repeat protein [Bacilli bacterium]